jgi:hypothetical protein
MDERMIYEFLSTWEKTPVRPYELLMLLQASEACLKAQYPKVKIPPRLVVEFSKVVAQQIFSSDAKNSF